MLPCCVFVLQENHTFDGKNKCEQLSAMLTADSCKSFVDSACCICYLIKDTFGSPAASQEYVPLEDSWQHLDRTCNISVPAIYPAHESDTKNLTYTRYHTWSTSIARRLSLCRDQDIFCIRCSLNQSSERPSCPNYDVLIYLIFFSLNPSSASVTRQQRLHCCR